MRIVPAPIADAFAADPRIFVGETKLVGRVTVEVDWYLTKAAEGLGLWPAKKSPVRWWQAAANDQVEMEIPNCKTLERNKSIENLAPTFDLRIFNQKMSSPEETATPVSQPDPTELGQPGYYTPTRGLYDEARARWGHVANEWQNVLVQNALVRVYQGIQGPDPDIEIADAVAAGYLMLRFVGMVDSVELQANGELTLKCRGTTGPLLVDQSVDVPLIPLEDYPFERHRWEFKNVPLNAVARDITSTTTTSAPPGDRFARYADSSTDHWSTLYGLGGPGSDSPLHGHYPSQSIDGNHDTWWVSNGNSYGTAPWAYDWLEYDCGGDIVNAIYVEPFAGNYQMFISVMENGSWQGGAVIPYDPSGLYGTQDVVDTGANIPYVSIEGVPWETGKEYLLPRAYNAQRIRITFHNLTRMEWGPWYYRAGVREFRARISAGGGSTTVTTVTTVHQEPIWLTAAPHIDSGYVTVDGSGFVDAFGAARVKTRTADRNPTNSITIGIRMTPTGNGYWVLEGDGRVVCYGDAVWYGDVEQSGFNHAEGLCNDIAITSTGQGYWIVQSLGRVHAFGDAVDIGTVTPTAGSIIIAIESFDDKLWFLEGCGRVQVRNGATNYGSFSPLYPVQTVITTNAVTSLRCTSTGLGYWILSADGHIQAFGDAGDVGNVAPLAENNADWRHCFWEIITVPGNDDGILVMTGGGQISPVGNVDPLDFYGGPSQGSAQLREDGNYLDLADIWRDLLLYSGYWLKEDVDPADQPSVFGILETTGTWVNDPLPASQFDKKPIADAIRQLVDITGYIMREGDDGSIIITSPNIWQSGNFLEDGTHTDVVPEIDERFGLFELSVSLPAKPIRSPITIASSKVDPHNPNATMHVTYTPPYAGLLRGMCRPAQWTNGNFTEPSEMKIMAELISLYIWFQLRLANVQGWIDPALEPDDQVRIIERETSEIAMHRVLEIHDTMDLDQGSWTMNLRTHWLGTDEQWAITADHVDLSTEVIPSQFEVSTELAGWMQGRLSDRSIIGHRNLQPAVITPTMRASGEPSSDPGAANG